MIFVLNQYHSLKTLQRVQFNGTWVLKKDSLPTEFHSSFSSDQTGLFNHKHQHFKFTKAPKPAAKSPPHPESSTCATTFSTLPSAANAATPPLNHSPTTCTALPTKTASPAWSLGAIAALPWSAALLASAPTPSLPLLTFWASTNAVRLALWRTIALQMTRSLQNR